MFANLTDCFDIYFKTEHGANTTGWTLGPCSSSNNYSDHKQYIQRCCVLPQQHILTCYNTKKSEGWKGGYVEIRGHRYCNDFMDYKAIRRIDVRGKAFKCQTFKFYCKNALPLNVLNYHNN